MSVSTSGTADDFGNSTSTLSTSKTDPSLIKVPPSDNSRTGAAGLEYKISYNQWAVQAGGAYIPCSDTTRILPEGFYDVRINDDGKAVFLKLPIINDDYLHFRESIADVILKEVDDFWDRKPKFDTFGFVHRRGYMMYGPAGSGKSTIAQQIIHHVIANGGIAFNGHNPGPLVEGLRQFRSLEPTRKIVVLFEDIDAIITNRGDEVLLQYLDGESQINSVLNIATTNYPERLDRRIIARPRRFDRLLKIGMPSDAIRAQYFTKKLGISQNDVGMWVDISKGFPFSGLSELVISHMCFEVPLEEAAARIRTLVENRVSSSEFSSPAGFRGASGSFGFTG